MQTTRVPGGVGIVECDVSPVMWAFVDYCRSKGDEVEVEIYGRRMDKATLTIAYSDEEDQCYGSLLTLLSLLS
jgi:hypothetical protein